MLDRVLATISVLAVIAFLGLIASFIKELDLIIVIVIVVAMIIYDFIREMRRTRG